MAVGDEAWVPRDPNWTPFGRAFDEMMGRATTEWNALDIPDPPQHKEHFDPTEWETNKIAYVLPVSEEYLAMQQFDWNDAIKRAPARRCQRLAMETYWTEVPEWDNPCVVRGDN